MQNTSATPAQNQIHHTCAKIDPSYPRSPRVSRRDHHQPNPHLIPPPSDVGHCERAQRQSAHHRPLRYRSSAHPITPAPFPIAPALLPVIPAQAGTQAISSVSTLCYIPTAHPSRFRAAAERSRQARTTPRLPVYCSGRRLLSGIRRFSISSVRSRRICSGSIRMILTGNVGNWRCSPIMSVISISPRPTPDDISAARR